MVIGVVVDVLDPAIGKVDRVMSLPASCSIAMLLLIKTGASVAVSNSIVVVEGNYLMDFLSISVTTVSKSMTTSMSNSMTSMSAAMPKTSMANARASMVTKTTMSSMSSTEAINLCRAGSQEGRDANEDLHSV